VTSTFLKIELPALRGGVGFCRLRGEWFGGKLSKEEKSRSNSINLNTVASKEKGGERLALYHKEFTHKSLREKRGGGSPTRIKKDQPGNLGSVL